jgi:uncharacterized caspase-like protein
MGIVSVQSITPVRHYAIIIGVNDYEDDSIPPLRGPAQDAMNLAQVLQDRKIAGYEVKLLTNSSSYEINKAVESLCSSVCEDDVLLFHYSGHGYLDKTGEFYMLSSDTRLKLKRSTAVSGRFVSDVMSDSKCKNQLMLLDCCHGGAFAKTLSGRHIEGGRVVITASPASGYSYENRLEESGLFVGAFTQAFVEGLSTGCADQNKDGKVSALEMYSYIYSHVTEHQNNQVPLLWVFGLEEDLIIANSGQENHCSPNPSLNRTNTAL